MCWADLLEGCISVIVLLLTQMRCCCILYCLSVCCLDLSTYTVYQCRLAVIDIVSAQLAIQLTNVEFQNGKPSQRFTVVLILEFERVP